MAPLSFHLAGVVLDHEMNGEHLDKSKKTIDPDLELQNFKSAGTVLAGLWHGKMWANHPIQAAYVDPPGEEALAAAEFEGLDHEWIARHAKCVMNY